MRHKPHTTFGKVKADVLADKDPHFTRSNFCNPRLRLARVSTHRHRQLNFCTTKSFQPKSASTVGMDGF
jgi:hypothetical protein